MRSRSAQVTLFVIIGLVLLLIVALFLFMRRSASDVEPDDRIVTHDFSAVKASYEQEAESCLLDEGKRVLKETFAHGGYYEPAEQGITGFEDNPTMGTGLHLSGGFLVPYWLEQGSPAGCVDNCKLAIRIPPLTAGEGGSLPSVEEQVAEAMEENIKPCLDRISFSDDYDVETEDDFAIDVSIGEGHVRYDLEREVWFTYIPTGENMTVDHASADQEVPAKELYESMRNVIEFTVLMNKSDTVHNAIKHIIEAYSMGEDPELPPMYGGTKFETKVHDMWMYPDVKEALRTRLADNIPLIQLGNTADRQVVVGDNRFSQAISHTGPFKPDIIFDRPGYAGGVAYSAMYDSDWDIDLKMGPGNGYILKPEGMSLDLLVLQLGYYEYYFTYDVVVPLMFVADDPDAFGGEGLSLFAGVEAGLISNDPMLYSDPEVLDTGEFGDDLFSMEAQRMDGNITINVTDALTGDPLEEVLFTYSCGRTSTEANQVSGEDGLVVTSLPFCIDGMLTGEKEGYYIDPTDLDVLDDSDRYLEVPAYPLKEFDLEVEGRLLFKKLGADVIYDEGELLEEYEDEADRVEAAGLDPMVGIWEVGTEPVALGLDDLLTVIVRRHVGPGEPEQVQVRTINYTNAGSQKLKLAKGTYDVEAFLMTQLGEGRQYENVYIPEKTYTWGEGWFDGPAGEETVEAVELNESLYRGGVRLTDDRALEVEAADYQNGTLKLKVVVVNIDDLQHHADLGVLGQIDGYSRMYGDLTEPEFVS